MKANAGMPHRHGRAQYQHMSEMKWGRMVGLREAGLSYCDISAPTGHAAMTVIREWNQWIKEDHMQR